MLYTRQKKLLSLLQACGGKLGATDFQKLLFLYSQLEESESSYDFVPYRFGCYSFQATADKKKLVELEHLMDADDWILRSSRINYCSALKTVDREGIERFSKNNKRLRGKSLITHIYKNYPYYAINSEIVDDYLDKKESNIVRKLKPKKDRTMVFATIGYEGESIENYINRLIKNRISLLVDVRKNPLSRKFGFSKKSLSSILEKFNISYKHMPELGIDSSDRKELNCQKDYDDLFDKYEKSVISINTDALSRLYDSCLSQRRVAITCFEKGHLQCHRSRVATAITKLSKGKLPALHI